MDDLTKRVRDWMKQWNMAARGERVIAGVSGGADSVCLCLLLHELSADMGFELSVVHVEHGIRGEESLADAAFVEKLCRSWHIPFVLRHVNVPEYAKANHVGEEEAARILRYGVFAEAVDNAQPQKAKLALAHHMEDNAETMLLHMVRGTGLDGMCGMQPVRVDEAGYCYIRPLLDVRRSEIEQFLTDRGQEFCSDSTNDETDYNRNFVRHCVLPLLSRVNEQAVPHMNRTARVLSAVRDYMEEAAQREYSSVVKYTNEPAEAGESAAELRLDIRQLALLPEALQARLIHRAIGEAAGGKKDIASVHIESVRQMLTMQTGQSINLPYGIVALREYDAICLCRRAQSKGMTAVYVTADQLKNCLQTGEILTVSFGTKGERLELSAFFHEDCLSKISSKMYTKCFDYDMIKDGFCIRSRMDGDYFVMDGHHKKLSNYFTDQKIPLGQRDKIPLIARESEILWIIGGRMGCSGMITGHTKAVLEIAYMGGTEDG